MPPKKRTSDVISARNRLNNILLQDPAGGGGGSENDYDEEELLDAAEMSHAMITGPPPQRGRPPKKTKLELTSSSPPPTNADSPTTAIDPTKKCFVMKLFDRSVDLAKYNESTALYPICRAWMINQPRSNRLINFANKPSPVKETRNELSNILEYLKNGKITDINSMPACKEQVNISRVPDQKPIKSDDINLDYDLNNPTISRAQILKELKQRSQKVRTNWQAHTRSYEHAKCSTGLQVLEYLFVNK